MRIAARAAVMVAVVSSALVAQTPEIRNQAGQRAVITASDIAQAAAPFGLRMGMLKTELAITATPLAPGKYKLDSVPRPHPDFETYVVEIAPSTGVCWIKAIGKEVSSSSHGTEIKTQFESILGQIANTYGKSESHDFLLPGSIWDEPRDWMMGMVKHERVLAAHWSSAAGSTLKPGLREVYLTASAVSSTAGFVSVEYYFDNEQTCEAEIQKQTGSVF